MYEFIVIILLNLAWLVTGVLLYFETKFHKTTRALLNDSCAKIDQMAIDGNHRDRNNKFKIDSLEGEVKNLHSVINSYKNVISEQNEKLLKSQPKKKTKKGKKNVRHA